jgi:Flp pilus assembly protein TadG
MLSFMQKRFLFAARRFAQSREGAVAIFFALSMLPLTALAGAAIDFAGVNRSRSMALSIADSAALAAVSDTVVKPTVSKAQQKEVSMAAAKSEFEALLAISKAPAQITTTSFDVQEEGSSISITICFTGSHKTTLMAVAGLTSLDFSGCSTASSASPVYVSVYALVDASGSMGIGATYADQSLMERRLGCAFACHSISNSWDNVCNTDNDKITPNWGYATTKCAKTIGAKTRFDIVREALVRVTDQAQGLQRTPQQYTIGVHKFSNYLTEIHANSSSMSSVKTALERMTMDARGAGSNFYKVLPEFARALPTSGDGKSPQTPKIFALILTDGIGSRMFEEDRCYFDSSLRPNCYFEGSWRNDPDYELERPFVTDHIRSQAFPAKLCDDIKRKNITVMTLATEYDANNINSDHMKYVDKTLRALSLNGLQGCATAPNFAFRANHGPDIDNAIRSMFSSIVEKARIVR